MCQDEQTELSKYTATENGNSDNNPSSTGRSRGPDEYQFKVTRHWRGNRLVVNSQDREGSGWMVKDRETAIESIHKALQQAASSIVATEKPLPTEDNVTIVVAKDLDFRIEPADVLPDPDELEQEFLI